MHLVRIQLLHWFHCLFLFLFGETHFLWLKNRLLILSQGLSIDTKNSKSFNKIIELSKSALEIEPNNVVAYIYLARANLGLGKNDIALSYSNKAIKLNNKDYISYQKILDTYKNIGLRFLFLDLKMPPPFF